MTIATLTASYYLSLAGLVMGAIGHDPFPGPVEVLRYSFDDKEELDLLPGLWQPRDWTRRKGLQFPRYVSTGIDRARGYNSRQGYSFAVNGGQAVSYSPPVHIDPLHSYVFQGYIRTQLLKQNAALLSVSFLNHERQRVQRFLSPPVTGTHRDWIRVRIGPIAPREDVGFVVIGCHLTHGKKMDIHGGVWFDELFLGRLPQLWLASNFQTHFKRRSAPIEISVDVSGLDIDQLCSIVVDDQPELIPSLDEGVVPSQLKEKIAEHAQPLSGQAAVKIDQDGRWLFSDDGTTYLVMLEDNHLLAVYDTKSPYTLQLKMLDSADSIIAETSFPLDATPPRQRALTEDTNVRREPQTWRLPAQEYGYYRVRSTLERDGVVILETETVFAVIELTDRVLGGEFGWSIEKNASQMSPRDFAEVAAQAGINWVKHPVWKSAYGNSQKDVARVAELFDRLARRGITPIGVLSDPLPYIRNKFSRDWTGISEIFALPRSSWSPWLEPVIARYSSNIQHWQLGADDDVSFVGMKSLTKTILNVKQEFDRIGRNTQIGTRWDWKTPLPSRAQMPQTFLSLDDISLEMTDEDDTEKHPMTSEELISHLGRSSRSGFPQWVLIKPQSSALAPQARGADLVKRMVSAKIGRANAIFATHVFHKDYGLLDPIGAPTVLFLPWRTTALSLQGAEFLGSFNLAGGSTNYAFARDGNMVLFVWNEDESVTEKIYLGERSQIVVVDLWGRHQAAAYDDTTKRQVIESNAIPKLVVGCSEALARWRLATRFEKSRLPSATGRHKNAIIGRNTFPQGVNGRVTINVPPGWEISPSIWDDIQLGPGEEFSLETDLTIPANTSLGSAVLSIDFEIDADDEHHFRIDRPIEIGLGDVFMHVIDRKLPDGRVEIEHIIVNRTNPEEVLNFTCSLFVPNYRRQKKLVTKLGNGKNQKKYYLPNVNEMRGKEIWLRAKQVDGRRVLNYRWNVGRYWDLPEKELQELLKQLQAEWDKPLENQ